MRVQRIEDRLAHVVQVIKHVVIAHAEHAISLLGEPYLSRSVGLAAVIMAIPIHLDHQSRGVAIEVD